MSEVEPSQTPARGEQPRGLLRSSGVVGGMTMISRVLGMLRDMVIARYLGADASADAFFVAFRIPNFFRRLFAEGAFAQAFVPVLSEYRSQGSRAAVRQLLDAVAGALGSTLLLFTVVCVLAAPAITALFAPGFMADPAKYQLAVELIRITLPYLMLISLTGFLGGVLNSYDRYAAPAVTPALLNLCLIAAAVLGGHYLGEPAYALAVGVFAAGTLQVLFLLPFLAALGLLPRPRWQWSHPGVKKILWLMLPTLFGVSVGQINLLLDTVIASFLPTGSVSWLYYSDRLVELPMGVFAIAVATVILPNLSRQHASQDPALFGRTLDWAIRMVVLVALPATLALIVLAEPILATLFLYGEMTAVDVSMAAISLRAYAVGLLGMMLVKVLAPGFFARQDTRTPVKIGIIAMAVNMVLNLLFVLPLDHYWQVGHAGLALATAISTGLNALMLWQGLHRQGVHRWAPGWRTLVVQMALANLAMVALLLVAVQAWSQWADWYWWQRGWRLALICLAGLSAYAAMLWLSGVRLRHVRLQQPADA